MATARTIVSSGFSIRPRSDTIAATRRRLPGTASGHFHFQRSATIRPTSSVGFIVPRLSKSVLALVAASAGALTIATQFIGEKEGLSLQPYLDSAGTWTDCRGRTRGVDRHKTRTQEECDRFFASDVGAAFAEAERTIKVPLSEPAMAAAVSFCFYNLGQPRCRKTGFIDKLNSGDVAGACAIIRNATGVDGKDCLDPLNKCGGIPIRRDQEYQLCLM